MSNNNSFFESFKKSIQGLEEVLSLEKNDINRDSAIKRFEICFDLAWKSVKIKAKEEGMECYSPRECFKTAFQIGLIDYNDKWIEIIESRNLTAHIYKEEGAEKVYSYLPEYLELFKKLSSKLIQSKQ